MTSQFQEIHDALCTYLWETAPVLLAILGPEGEIRSANVYARHLLGTDILGKRFFEAAVDVPDSSDVGFLAAHGEAIVPLTLKTASNGPTIFEFRFLRMSDGCICALAALNAAERENLMREVYGLKRDVTNLSHQLQHANGELRGLTMLTAEVAAQAEHAREEERRRLARGLHDETGSALANLKIGLATIGELGTLQEVHHHSRELAKLADTTMKDVTRLARGLHPLILEDLGLAAALRSYADICASTYKIRIEVHVGTIQDALDATHELALYRVAQEAVQNACKHAKAANVSVVIDRDGAELRAVIEDDGIGMPPPQPLAPRVSADGKVSFGIGLISMRERLSSLGGTLEIESTPGGGTSVFARLPIRAFIAAVA